jgi:Ca2+-binding EF-hand superfamily protein
VACAFGIPTLMVLRIQVGQKALWEQTYTMFLRFDKDNKGTLNRAEVELGIQRFGAQLSAEQIDEMLSAIGANAGELNVAQFMTLLSMMTGLKDRKHTTMEGPRGTEYMKVAEKAMWEQMHNLFVKFDTDNSGYVDVKEVMQGIGRFGANLTEEQVKEIFRRIGVDDRGLSKSQFMTLLSMIMTLQEKPKLKAGTTSFALSFTFTSSPFSVVLCLSLTLSLTVSLCRSVSDSAVLLLTNVTV